MLLERTHRKSNYQIPMQMGSWEAKTGVTTRSGFENTQLSSFIITGLLHRGKRSNSNHGLYDNTNKGHANNLVHTNQIVEGFKHLSSLFKISFQNQHPASDPSHPLF